jgi:ABC-type sugar transport system permease subunit
MDIAAQARFETLLWAAATVVFILVGSILVGQIARVVARAARLTAAEQRKVYWGFLFAAPWIIGFLIFVVGPALASLWYSFTDYKLGDPAQFVGLENYRDLLTGSGAHGRRFAQAMYNSFYYAVFGVPLQILTALGMAMLLNTNLRGIRFFRLVFYLPVILAGGPAVLLAWRYMLASNGGFINVTLQGAAESFFLFDWLYRGFILGMEALNGFYAGITRGDPIGTLKYVIPAGLGTFVFYTLWRGAARGLAYRVAEILAGITVVILAARALITDPVDPVLLVGLSIGVCVLLWMRTKNRASGIVAVLLCIGVVAYLARFDGAHLLELPKLLLLQSTIATPDNVDYLNDVYPHAIPSALWVFGLVAAALYAVALTKDDSRQRRYASLVAFLVFGAFTLGAVLDGVRYFNAYSTISVTTGDPNYHFTLFRAATEQLPDSNRVPLWLSNELWAKPSLILITMWSSGAGMLIFLAALKGIPQSFYEAAEVDGANRMQRFFKITLPLISPAMFYNIVIGVIAALQTFEAVYIIQTQQTQDSLASAAYFLFVRTFRQLAIGQGAAVSWILAVIIVLLTLLQFRYSRWVHYEA